MEDWYAPAALNAMYIFITVSMQIRIKNCGTLSSGKCAGPTVAALLGCMGWAGLG